MEYFREIIKPFNFTNVKPEIAGILAAITSFVANFSKDYLGISGGFSTVLFVLLITDFITGIRAASVTKNKITSRKGLRTVYKAGGYILFMYASYSLFKELEGKAELFETVLKYFHIYIIVHISFWELFSIDENLKKLGIDLGITSLLKSAYQNIKNIFQRTGERKDTYYNEEPEDYNDGLN